MKDLSIFTISFSKSFLVGQFLSLMAPRTSTMGRMPMPQWSVGFSLIPQSTRYDLKVLLTRPLVSLA